MNILVRALILAALFAFATSSIAAKPVKIKFIEDVIFGDSIYSHYVVVCSNNKRKDISAWNNRKSWCEGKGSKTRCKKQQLKTARKVCQSNR